MRTILLGTLILLLFFIRGIILVIVFVQPVDAQPSLSSTALCSGCESETAKPEGRSRQTISTRLRAHLQTSSDSPKPESEMMSGANVARSSNHHYQSPSGSGMVNIPQPEVSVSGGFGSEASNGTTSAINPFIVYVIDSGIRSTHVWFQRWNIRIERGVTFVPEERPATDGVSMMQSNYSYDNSKGPSSLGQPMYRQHQDAMKILDGDQVDGIGHGTFVASVLVSSLERLEANVSVLLVPLVVVNRRGQGSSETVLEATRYAIRHRQEKHPENRSILVIALAEQQQTWFEWMWSYFFYWISPEPFDQLFKEAHRAGFVTVAAGGNWNTDACFNRKRGRLPGSVLVVAASSSGPNERRASYSSYGECISLFAPGLGVGASAVDDRAITAMDGTSTAVPFVAASLIRYWNAHQHHASSALDDLGSRRPTNEELVSDYLLDPGYVKDDAIQDLQCKTMSSHRERAMCEKTTRKALVG